MSSSQQTKASQPNRPNKFNRDRNSFVSLVQSNAPQKIFTRNTAAHIVLPAFVGAILAGMLTYVDFKVEGEVIIPPPSEQIENNAFRTTSHYATYGIASAIASSLVTLGLVGLPDEESDRIRAWLVASVGAITLPLTMNTLLSFGATKAEVAEARVEILEKQNQLEQVTKNKGKVETKYLEILEEEISLPGQTDISKEVLLAPAKAILEGSKEISKQAEKNSVSDLKESLDEIEKIEGIVEEFDQAKPSNSDAESDQVDALKEQIEELKQELQVEIKKKKEQPTETSEE